MDEQRLKLRDYNEKLKSMERGLFVYFEIWSNNILCFGDITEKDTSNKFTSLQFKVKNYGCHREGVGIKKK